MTVTDRRRLVKLGLRPYPVAVGVEYMFAGFLAVPAVLWLFHRLSRPPRPASRPPRAEPRPGSVADEAEVWLRSQR